MTAKEPLKDTASTGPSDASAPTISHDVTGSTVSLDAIGVTVSLNASSVGKESVQPQPTRELSSDPADSHAIYKRSICLACQHRRTVVSGKGSVFLLCQSPAVETGWPKYPPQPLASCRHLQKKNVQTESPSAESS